MAHTTVSDFIDYAPEAFDAATQDRVEYWLPIAERKLARRVGQDFYGLDDTATADWIFATCVITDWLVTMGSAENRATMVGPYQSERLGDYAYTLKDSREEYRWSIWSDQRIRDILALYRVTPESERVYATVAGRAFPRAETTEIRDWWALP